MPFGRGDRRTDKRMVELGLGPIGRGKRDALARLHADMVAITTTMLAEAFNPEPLIGRDDLDPRLRALQKRLRRSTGVKSVYAERCRLMAQAMLSEAESRYLSRLLGRLRHADAEIPKSDPRAGNTGNADPGSKAKAGKSGKPAAPAEDKPARRWFAVPLEMQEQVWS